MQLDPAVDTLVFYQNHEYQPPMTYCQGWYVTYNPIGEIVEVIAVMDTGEWRYMTDLKDSDGWVQAFDSYVTGNPPDA